MMRRRFPHAIDVEAIPARESLPVEVALVRSMRATLAAAQAVLDAHDPVGNDCPCDLCDDVGHFMHFLDISESTISGSLRPILEEELAPAGRMRAAAAGKR